MSRPTLNKKRVALGVIGGLLLLIGLAAAVGVLGVPGVEAVDNSFGEVTDNETEIETALVVSNPNPFGIGNEGVAVNYTVAMNGIDMAHGAKEEIALDRGESTLALQSYLQNEAIPPWWTSHIENDEHTTIGIEANVRTERFDRGGTFSQTPDIETDIIGEFNSEETREIDADSPLMEDPVLLVNETQAAWGEVSEQETPIDKTSLVYNPNAEPYAITQLDYDISMNGVDLGDGETHEHHLIEPHSTEQIDLRTVIQNENLDTWWVTHLDHDIHGHQVSELRIEFSAVIETAGGEEISIPLDALTYEETIDTNIFDEGHEAATDD